MGDFLYFLISSYASLLKRNKYQILVVKSAEKRPLGRRRRRWEDTIQINLKNCEGVDWCQVIQGIVQGRAPVNMVM